MRLILIGNYLPDRQQSMIRFTDMLYSGFKETGMETEKWLPTVFFSKPFNSTQGGVAKWIGYIDKWLLFPLIMRLKLFRKEYNDAVFHICDHSNAPYLSVLPSERTSITCHDVIAIRSAMGFQDAAGHHSRFGYFYQKWIFGYLSKAKKIACVSFLTRRELLEILPEKAQIKQAIAVIPNAFNDKFFPVKGNELNLNLQKAGIDTQTPYILHVGGGHQRKNRVMLVKMVELLGDKWSGNICFTGQPLNSSLLDEIKSSGIEKRVFSVVNADHLTLMSLYSGAYAFIFPSLSEGFGWPVIEAQACGTPVITSNKEPMMEVSGNAALFADPLNPHSFADAFLKLGQGTLRDSIIDKGFENCRRFELQAMLDVYLDFYKLKPERD